MASGYIPLGIVACAAEDHEGVPCQFIENTDQIAVLGSEMRGREGGGGRQGDIGTLAQSRTHLVLAGDEDVALL